MTEWLDWHNCYDDGWKGIIHEDAFRHPAKFAYGLITRIYRHGLAEGYWKPGDLIGDPFGGVGLGGIVAAYHNLRWIGVELESEANGGSPFVELAQANFEKHRRAWVLGGEPMPRIVQGDSRRFAEIVGEVCGVVTSPPYIETKVGGNNPEVERDRVHRKLASGEIDPATAGKYSKHSQDIAPQYGSTNGQIGALKEGSLDAVVTSPPYAESVKGDHSERETAAETTAKRRTEGGSLGASQRHGGYGASEGNIGNLKEGTLDGAVTSPPYATSVNDRNGIDREKIKGRKGGPYSQVAAGGYGEASGQIGNLPEGVLDGAVTSPPWEKSLNDGYDRSDPAERYASWAKNLDGSNRLARSVGQNYGESDGQIGNDRGETYWQAMHAVYGQMFAAMKPGSIAAVVLKDYVKNKARVPLCYQSATLLEAIGFEVFCRCRCWLVKRTETPGLFGEPIVEETSRKSFFRRLAEAKGSPRIDYEEVIWCRKPGGLDEHLS